MADTSTLDDESLDKDGEAAQSDAPPQKSGSKKLIMFAAIGVVVAGAAAGGAFVFLSGGDTVAEAEDEPPVIAQLQRIEYIDIDPVFVQVETDAGELQNVVVELALEVEKDSDDEARVKLVMPRLYEAYLRALTDRPLPGAADGKVEVTYIKNRIRAENLEILGPGVVHDVVLRNFWFSKE